MNDVLGPTRAKELRWEDPWRTQIEWRPLRHTPQEVACWPSDLRTWVAPSTLLVWIEEELNHVDWHNPAIQEHLREFPEYRPKAMLRLLSFAYSAGLLRSQEISRSCQSDSLLYLLCDGPIPFAEELISFRRKNGEVLQFTLGRLLVRALRVRMGLAASDLYSILEAAATQKAVNRIEMALQLDGEVPSR